MIKIDLITGFLGSGKTTFIIEYAKYLINRGERICILENDFGAVNVDMMLLSSLNCDREMVSGGCDYDCHVRRFRTKLISMAMMGYTRVIVEPSGIYDTDEFFDVLYESPLDDLYEIGNIFCVYDINTKDLSYDSRYILLSESSVCGRLIITKNKEDEVLDLSYINSIMNESKCSRIFNQNDIIYFDKINFDNIINSGYHSYDHIKIPVIYDSNYDSVYILDKNIQYDDLKELSKELFSGEFGSVNRIKGFITKGDSWYSVNITTESYNISPISDGQKVIIIIGENINKEKIEKLFGDKYGL